MNDSKTLPLIGGVMLMFLSLMLVVVLLVGVMSGMGSAAECTPSPATEAAGMAWPTDKKEAAQGWDDEGAEKHKGMDFDVAKGSKVYAVESGDVKSVDGDWIKIKHGDAMETWYQFFETKTVKKGDKVERGQQIGTSGEGTETAPGKSGAHLHFEVWAQADDGGSLQQADPAKLFSAGGSGGSGCGCNTDGPLVGSTNQEKAFNYLVANGYTKEQAAGIVGNMIHESQVTPTLLNGTNPPTVTRATVAEGLNKAWGIVQWYPAKKMITASRSKGVSYETDRDPRVPAQVPEGAAGRDGTGSAQGCRRQDEGDQDGRGCRLCLRPRLRDLHDRRQPPGVRGAEEDRPGGFRHLRRRIG